MLALVNLAAVPVFWTALISAAFFGDRWLLAIGSLFVSIVTVGIAACCGRLRQAILCGVTVAPIAVPILVVTLLANVVLCVPDLLIGSGKWLQNKLSGGDHKIDWPKPLPTRVRFINDV